MDLASVSLIEEESDDPDLRERQRRAKENMRAIAYGMEELAMLIEESKNKHKDEEDIGFEQSM